MAFKHDFKIQPGVKSTRTNQRNMELNPVACGKNKCLRAAVVPVVLKRNVVLVQIWFSLGLDLV